MPGDAFAVRILEPDAREAVAPVHAAVDVHAQSGCSSRAVPGHGIARARSDALGPVNHELRVAGPVSQHTVHVVADGCAPIVQVDVPRPDLALVRQFAHRLADDVEPIKTGAIHDLNTGRCIGATCGMR